LWWSFGEDVPVRGGVGKKSLGEVFWCEEVGVHGCRNWRRIRDEGLRFEDQVLGV